VIPQSILDEFTKFNFLYEKSQKNILKNLFGETKDRIIIDNLSKELVQQELNIYITSRN
jgi:hypothetical protein